MNGIGDSEEKGRVRGKILVTEIENPS